VNALTCDRCGATITPDTSAVGGLGYATAVLTNGDDVSKGYDLCPSCYGLVEQYLHEGGSDAGPSASQ